MPSRVRRLRHRKAKRGRRGQIIILGALIMAVLLFTVVILSYTAAQYQRNPTVENVVEVVSNVKAGILKVLGASTAYYASILQGSGNRTYALGLATALLEDGLHRLGTLFGEWNPSFTYSNLTFETKWFEPVSFTHGRLNISFDLGKLGLTGVAYDADARLNVGIQQVNVTAGGVILYITGDYGRPLGGLTRDNFQFYVYNYTTQEWMLQSTNETVYWYNGTYAVRFPANFTPSPGMGVLIQVMDSRGIVVTASSFTKIHYNLTWPDSSLTWPNYDTFPIELLQNGTMRWLGKNYPWEMTQPFVKELIRDSSGKIFYDDFSTFDSKTWSIGNVGVADGSVTASGSLLRISGKSNASGVWRQLFAVTNSFYDFSKGAVFEINQKVPVDNVNSENERFSIIFYISNGTTTTENPANLANTNWLAVSINVRPKVSGKGIDYNVTTTSNNTIYSADGSDTEVNWRIIVNATGYVTSVWLDRGTAAGYQDLSITPFKLSFTVGYLYNVLSTRDSATSRTVTSHYNKAYISEKVTVICLANGQQVRMYDYKDVLVNPPGTVSANSSGVAVLDFSGNKKSLDKPETRPPYLKLNVYYLNGSLAYNTTLGDPFYNDIWGGDIYSWQSTLSRTEPSTPFWQPIPPIAVKQLRVNATVGVGGQSLEIPFQVEDWASSYTVPLGMTVNTTIFSKNQMLVFLINHTVTNVTVWWNGSDTADQTTFAYQNQYFNDVINADSATLDNGLITLDVWLSGSPGSPITFTFTSNGGIGTVYPIRFNSLNGEMGAQRATAVIYSGVVRDIIQYEAEWSGGVAGFPNVYAHIVITLPANATYFTWTTRVLAVNYTGANRNITDLSVMNLTVSGADTMCTERGLNGTSNQPLVSSTPGNYTNTAARGLSIHLFSEYFNTTGQGAGVMYTDATLRKLYFFDRIANASVGGLSVWNTTTSAYIDVDPVIAGLGVANSTTLNQALDISWSGMVVVINTPKYPHIYVSTTEPSLWVMVHYPPTITQELEG